MKWFVNGKEVDGYEGAARGKRTDAIVVTENLDLTRSVRFYIVHGEFVDKHTIAHIERHTGVNPRDKWVASMSFPTLRRHETRTVPAYFVEPTRKGICNRVRALCYVLGE